MQREEAEGIRLAAGSYREITALSWSWQGETVNLARDGETGRWINADDAACPVDDARAEALARAAASAAASSVIRSPEALEQYGLDSPELTVVAATEDRIVGYDVGSMSGTGERFLHVQGEDGVYLAGSELFTAFRVGIRDLLALESVPGDIDAVSGLSVRSGAEDYRISWNEEEGCWYRSDAEPPLRLEEEGVRPLVETLTELELTDCVTWNGDPADYGLRSPQAAGTVTYRDGAGEERSFTLEFGDYAEGDIYVRFAGSSMVFLVPGTTADALMYPLWDRMSPTPVVDPDPSALASLSLTLDGESREIVRLEEVVERTMAQGDGSVAVTEVIYSMNGWVLDTQKVDSWLESFSRLTAEGSAPAGEGREELLSVTFTWKDEESSPFTLALRSYDSAHYLCLAGDERLLVSREAGEGLIERSRSLLAGE